MRGTFSRNRNRKTPYYGCTAGIVINRIRLNSWVEMCHKSVADPGGVVNLATHPSSHMQWKIRPVPGWSKKPFTYHSAPANTIKISAKKTQNIQAEILHECQNVFSFRGVNPLSKGSSAPGPLWGLSPLTAIIGLRYHAPHLPLPSQASGFVSLTNAPKSAMTILKNTDCSLH